MALPRLVVGGIVATALLLVLPILFFFQTKDPMLLLFGLQAVLVVWIVILVLHVLRRGIPVRVIDDEKKP